MDRVRKMIRGGASIPTAIKESLGMSVSEFALKHKRPRVNTGEIWRGKRAPTDADIAALIDELGGTDQEWRELLHEAGRPTAKVG